MKNFFRTFFACLIALGVFMVLCVLFISVLAMFSEKKVAIKNQSILHLKLDVPIVDKAEDNPLANFDWVNMKPNPNLGLNVILQNIKKASTDDKIKGILIETSMINAGMASVEEIRDALVEFKESGKFIVSYGEIYTHKDYYLASVSDKVFLFPEGLVEFRGLSSKVMFLKGLLEKLDIEPQIIRHGKFKSAIEPLILDQMSEANKEQTMEYVSDLWNHMVEGISASREVSIEELNRIANELKIRSAEDALEHGFVDSLMYKDELINYLKAKTDIKEDKKLNMVSMMKYKEVIDLDLKKKPLDKKVAVIYAQGDINSGKSDPESIGSETLAGQIRKARKDDKIKSIVLRVNSPGGSALASDVIWREMVLAKETKPLVVSMGNVAASGGYYISCPANAIFASENTITGSIGVFGVIPNFQGFFENKLGITFDGVKTNDHSDIQSLVKPLDEHEREIIQEGVEDIYDDFIGKVAEGRSITKAAVDSIGQGRVWSGIDAKRIGLIDEFGGLNASIEKAAELAELEEYQIVEFPEKKEFIVALLEGMTGEDAQNKWAQEKLGTSYKYFKYLEQINKLSGTQARIPYYFEIE